MREAVRSEVMTAFRSSLERRGIDASSTRSDFPVEVVRGDMVPVIGNVHLPTGRVAKRADVDRRFARLKF